MSDEINTEQDALAAAQRFLQDRPGIGGPFRVRAEQDFWVVTARAADGSEFKIFVDAFDGGTFEYAEKVVQVRIVRPDEP